MLTIRKNFYFALLIGTLGITTNSEAWVKVKNKPPVDEVDIISTLATKLSDISKEEGDLMPGVALLVYEGRSVLFSAKKSAPSAITGPLLREINKRYNSKHGRLADVNNPDLGGLLTELRKLDLLPADNSDLSNTFQFNQFSHTERQLIGASLLYLQDKKCATYWSGKLELQQLVGKKATIHLLLNSAPCNSGGDYIDSGGSLEDKKAVHCVNFYYDIAKKLPDVEFHVYFPIEVKYINVEKFNSSLKSTDAVIYHGGHQLYSSPSPTADGNPEEPQKKRKKILSTTTNGLSMVQKRDGGKGWSLKDSQNDITPEHTRVVDADIKMLRTVLGDKLTIVPNLPEHSSLDNLSFNFYYPQ